MAMSDDIINSIENAEEICVDCDPPLPGKNGLVSAPPNGTNAIPNGASSMSATSTEVISPPQRESLRPSILIEFCDRCRWAPRATWIQTELFLTFPTPIIGSITLLPLRAPESSGRFRVWLETEQGVQLVWDRKSEGGFPELRVLKQRVRNIVQPDLNLGHSDVKAKQPPVPVTTA